MTMEITTKTNKQTNKQTNVISLWISTFSCDVFITNPKMTRIIRQLARQSILLRVIVNCSLRFSSLWLPDLSHLRLYSLSLSLSLSLTLSLYSLHLSFIFLLLRLLCLIFIWILLSIFFSHCQIRIKTVCIDWSYTSHQRFSISIWMLSASRY